MLEILSALTQHYWKYFNITTTVDTSEEIGNTIAVESPDLRFPFSIEYADSVMQDSNGDIVLNNPKTVEILTSQDNMSALVLPGKYLKTYPGESIVYCPANATIVVTGTVIMSSPYLRKVIFKRETEYVGLVSSPDESTYPKNGDIGDIYYSYVGTVLKNSIPGAKIAIGSYIGTGKYGIDNPNTLTFNFVPKIVMITGQRYIPGGTPSTYTSMPYVDCEVIERTTGDMFNLCGFELYDGYRSTCYAAFDKGTKTLRWASSDSAGRQYNNTNYKYYYTAL